MDILILPKLTITMAVRNAAEFVGRALDSLVAQHYPNLEVIVYDGLSTDNTLHILEKYSHIITIMKSEADSGVSDAYNKAISLATGDYIGFLNADDELESGALWAVADAISGNPDTEVVTFGILYRVYNGNNSTIKGYYADKRQLALTLKYVLIENQTFMLSRFFKRSLLEEIGEINTDHSLWYISNDREYMSRLALRGCKNVIIPKAYYGFVLHKSSMSNNPANYCRIIEEHGLIAARLLSLVLDKEQRDIVMNWHKRQLVFGFWQMLAQRNIRKALKFFYCGLRTGDISFIILCGKLLIEKIIKRICLNLSRGIDAGAF